MLNFKYNGEEYFRDENDVIYSNTPGKLTLPVGKWNRTTSNIEFN